LLGRKRTEHRGSHVIKILEFNDVEDLVNNFAHVNRIKRYQPIDMIISPLSPYNLLIIQVIKFSKLSKPFELLFVF
jgi:hypothetical protein